MADVQNLKVTTFDELVEYAKGEVVELPPFGNGQRFIARLKRPSMMTMLKNGTIPNKLLQSAMDLFDKKNLDEYDLDDSIDADGMSEMLEILDILCGESFAEPTYAEIKESGVQLNDKQLMFMFNWVQKDINNLDPFRQE